MSKRNGRQGKVGDDGRPDGYALAHAAAWDVGNASMRAGGRQAWNVDDYNAAARALERLLDAGAGGPPVTFGERLWALRLRRMLTQRELAEHLGVDQRMLSRWESGRNVPRPARQRQLCEALGVTPEQLLGEDR